ncbi:O-methyltransferase [Paenibacillus wenxiniae]|uniref:O-methyltransferase n=1 Tax=Paenibacillus wenxiniae TaxID=1636843 RepID=A0ABW4RJ45_9BACL
MTHAQRNMNPAQQQWYEVDQYVNERLHLNHGLFEQILQRNRKANLPPIDVSPAQGALLQQLIMMSGTRRVLEIGTLGGYSTIWMAQALPQDGQIVTLELEENHAAVARINFEQAGVYERIEQRTGEALVQLQQLADDQVEPFDFIFIDADKPNNPAYLKWALHFSHPGTIIFADNVVREGEIIDPHSTDPRIHGVRTFYDVIHAEPRLRHVTTIQTVGEKGYDGFLMGIVG